MNREELIKILLETKDAHCWECNYIDKECWENRITKGLCLKQAEIISDAIIQNIK